MQLIQCINGKPYPVYRSARRRICIATRLLMACLCLYPTVAGSQDMPLYPAMAFPGWDSTQIDSNHLFRLIHTSNRLWGKYPDSAQAILEKVVSSSHATGFYDGIVEGSYLLGYMYTQKGSYAAARQWFRHALIYSVKGRRTPFKVCRILINIGNIYQFEGDYKHAATYYFYAASLAEKTVKTDAAIANPLIRIYNYAGSALLQFDKYEKAMYYFNKAEAVTRMWDRRVHLSPASVQTTAVSGNSGWDMNINLPGIWANKAIVYYRTGFPEKAWEYNQKAQRLAIRYENTEVQIIVLQNMADLARDSGRSTRAIAYLEEALQLRSTFNPYYTTRTLYSLGTIHLSLKDHIRAEHYFNAAFRQAVQSNMPEHQLRIHRQLAILYDRTHNYREAFGHQRAAYMLNDSLLNKEKAVAVEMLEIKYRTAEKDKKLAQNQLMIARQEIRLREKDIWIYGITAALVLMVLMVLSLYRIGRHKQRIRLLKAVIEGEEKERSRIARELHDGIGGLVSAMSMNVMLLGKEQQVAQAETYRKVLQMADEISNEVRKTAHNLMPEILIRHSLPEAVQLFCNHVSKGTLDIDIQAYGPFERLGQDIRLSLYRIIQELVQNIVKHAHATHALVQMTLQDATLCIIAEDNGIGIGNGERSGGMGLQSLRSRVQSLNGQVSIESRAGKGTTVFIEFNLTDT